MKPSETSTTVLVLGATGMLGHAALRLFARSPGMNVVGTTRSELATKSLPVELRDLVVTGVDVENSDRLIELFGAVRPDVVINAVGVVKQLERASHPQVVLPINAILPHRLVRLCELSGARLVHISTDCVFAGTRGGYRETDPSDALDLYGRSKYMGEVDAPNAITLRTSIIGHELATKHGLVEWFLGQGGPVKGFQRAVFSGVPTAELARVLRDVVLPRPQMRGLYHLAAAPISKYDLLSLVAKEYQRTTTITPDTTFIIDRSLDGSKFCETTGYVAPPWPELIASMKRFG